MFNPAHLKKLIAITAFIFLAGTGTASAIPTPVDLELSLLVDVSGSVTASEFDLQKTGYANAFNDAGIIAAIQNGTIGKIAVNFIYWSSEGDQSEAVGWSLIEDATSANAFATAISNSTRPFSGLTAPGSAINFTVPDFASNDFTGTRKVIDVSGDGSENDGDDTSDARDAAANLGITINGLVITDFQSVVDFYNDNVITNDGFLVEIDDFDDFAVAIRTKLAREIGDPCVNNPQLPQCGGGGGNGVIPEPSSMLLLGSGLAAAFLRKRKK